jgi:hypothetical protein
MASKGTRIVTKLLLFYSYAVGNSIRHHMAERAQNNTHYTYRDYSGWPDDERWELIDGTAYNMTPAPTTQHQGIVGNIFGVLFGMLRGHACRVLSSPLDVQCNPTSWSSVGRRSSALEMSVVLRIG